MKVDYSEFVTSAREPADYPPPTRPDVAFAGRSNVGKSSLINTLLTRKKLARVSKTPGRTRSLNFYDVSGEVYFVDLPGYGYADVPTEEKKAWAPMIETYLRRRRSLAALVCVMDLRRGMEGDDQQLIESAPHFGVQPILVFTKADKFGEQKRARRRREIAEEFGVEVDELLLFSSEERIGQRDLWRRIDERTGAGR